jgi:hypothetical protein
VLLPSTLNKLCPALLAAELMLPERVGRPLDAGHGAPMTAVETMVNDCDRGTCMRLRIGHSGYLLGVSLGLFSCLYVYRM